MEEPKQNQNEAEEAQRRQRKRQKKKKEKRWKEKEREKRKEIQQLQFLTGPVPPRQHKARTWRILLNDWEERSAQTQERSAWIFFKNMEELGHSNPTLYVCETETVTPLRLMADLIASAVPGMCIATLQYFAQEACGVGTQSPRDSAAQVPAAQLMPSQ